MPFKPREHHPDAGAAPPRDLYNDQILVEQVRQLYKMAPVGLVATALNSVLVFFVMQDQIPKAVLAPWLGCIFLITVLRGFIIFKFRGNKLTSVAAQAQAKWFLAGVGAIGVAWGSLAFYPLSEISIAHQVFLVFVLGGMAAGASSTFSTVKHVYAAFSVPALTPLALHFILLNDPFHYAMAAMTALFGFLLWRISLHNYGINRTSLLLRYENIQVIESLKEANEHVQGLNAQLRSEVESRLAAEADLREHQEQLEKVVEERTADLRRINEQLKVEIEGRKQYEQALRESKERLEAAQRNAEAANVAKGEFLANMSHEMRTPLAGVLGMIKLVLDMEIGSEERQLLEMAKRSADSLLRIISDVLDFSRLEAGMMTFESNPFSVAEVVQSAVEVVSLTAAEKGLHLHWAVEDPVPDQVAGDQGRLRQVLVNLVGNAVKFTERGEVEVTVRMAPPDQAGRNFILFTVRDSGIGIPPEQLERIFGRFTQVDSSLTRRHGGTGLGLALTRQIVENIGGSIWAESIVGKGSVFSFTFPAG